MDSKAAAQSCKLLALTKVRMQKGRPFDDIEMGPGVGRGCGPLGSIKGLFSTQG